MPAVKTKELNRLLQEETEIRFPPREENSYMGTDDKSFAELKSEGWFRKVEREQGRVSLNEIADSARRSQDLYDIFFGEISLKGRKLL